VHVPLERPADTKALARRIAETLAARHAGEVVAEMRKESRPGKVYVDWLQNDVTRQTVAPYSLRGMPWPTVAAPLTWDEVGSAVSAGRPERFTILAEEMTARVERLGDLFEPLLGAERGLGLPEDGPG
jgi:bifunctional non-homologous end joining protein LigD